MRIVGYFFLQLIVSAAVVAAANVSTSSPTIPERVNVSIPAAPVVAASNVSSSSVVALETSRNFDWKAFVQGASVAAPADPVRYQYTGECNSCGVSNYYQCNTLNENCFYFGQTSRCSGCCTSRMELDPFGLLPKEVNQSCCVPVQRVLKQTTLWCYGEADLSKETDPRYPGWYFQNGFQYSVVTQCSCEEPDWQATAVKTSGPILETIKPEESLLTDCMKEIHLQQPCFYLSHAGQNLHGCPTTSVSSFEVCQQACLKLGISVCAAINFTFGANFCGLCAPLQVANAGFVPDPDTSLFMRNTACGKAGFQSLSLSKTVAD